MICKGCNGKIKDGLRYCPICGTDQTMIVPQVPYQMPMMSNIYQQQVMNNMYQYQVPQTKNSSGLDIASFILFGLGGYYLLNILIIVSSGIDAFISENDLAEDLEMFSAGGKAFSVNWPLFVLPIIGLVLGFISRNRKATKQNLISIIGNAVILACGIISTVYFYTYFN